MYLHGIFKKQYHKEKGSPDLPNPAQDSCNLTSERKGKDLAWLMSLLLPITKTSDSKNDKHLLNLVTGCSKSHRLMADLR